MPVPFSTVSFTLEGAGRAVPVNEFVPDFTSRIVLTALAPLGSIGKTTSP